jgi:hypothetical protein
MIIFLYVDNTLVYVKYTWYYALDVLSIIHIIYVHGLNYKPIQ